MLFGSEVFLRIRVAVEFLTDQYPAILTSHLVINADIYLRFISIIAVSRAPSLPTNAGSSLSPVEKVTSNSITYIIGIVVAVLLLVLIAVAFYCYWRKKNWHEGNQAYDPQGNKTYVFFEVRSSSWAKSQKGLLSVSIKALTPNRTATIARKLRIKRFNEEENSTPREFL